MYWYSSGWRVRRFRGRAEEVASAGMAEPEAALQLEAHLLLSANSLLVLTTLLMPILSVDMVDGTCSALRAAVPHIGAAAAQCLRASARACDALRARQQLVFAILHGAITYATGDVIAQAALSGRASHKNRETSEMPALVPQDPEEARRRPRFLAWTSKGSSRTKKSERRVVYWRPLRSMLAAVVGILSDSLPFYYWSIVLARLDKSWLTRRFPSLLKRPAILVVGKVAAHLLVFQPACTAGYLLLTQLFRGIPWARRVSIMPSVLH